MLKLRIRENDVNTANLYLREGRVAKISSLSPSVIDITGLFAPERRRVEDFIKTVYKDSYGADIGVHYPLLMSVRNENGEILAAVGIRFAQREALFLEQYVGQPLENILRCPRAEIAEIGNLASAGQGASIFLFAALASYLHYKNIRYAAVTGTDFLHRYFEKLGLDPLEICEADIGALQSDGQSWGSYYDAGPRVLAGSVETGVKKLKSALGAEFEDCRPRLYPRLHCK